MIFNQQLIRDTSNIFHWYFFHVKGHPLNFFCPANPRPNLHSYLPKKNPVHSYLQPLSPTTNTPLSNADPTPPSPTYCCEVSRTNFDGNFHPGNFHGNFHAHISVHGNLTPTYREGGTFPSVCFLHNFMEIS